MKIYENMTTDEVIEYFNLEINKGRSAKEIEIEDFGVSERVIRKRLARKGIKIDVPKSNNKSITTVISKKDYESTTSIVALNSINNESITSVINTVIDVKSVNELTSLITPLKELLQKYHNSNYIIDVQPNEFKVNVASEVKSKVFKVDLQVLNQLDEFCALYPQYKLQDIISTLLLEAMCKYK